MLGLLRESCALGLLTTPGVMGQILSHVGHFIAPESDRQSQMVPCKLRIAPSLGSCPATPPPATVAAVVAALPSVAAHVVPC